MAKDLIDIFLDLTLQPILDAIFTDDFKGRHGEALTESKLKVVSLFGRKGKILRNVYIPKDNGETSEIDVMFICQKGIFVFESKNYSGWIFGNEKDQYWTASLASGYKSRFYNPIKQNRTHIKWLSNFLERENINVPMFSVIVFSERCELKKITKFSDDVEVIKRDKMYKTVRKKWDDAPDVMTEEMVEYINQKLEPLTKVDESVKQSHVEDIKNKMDNPDMVCPRCGNKLVLRTARKGSNPGQQFYGCSAFPKCRYIKNQ